MKPLNLRDALTELEAGSLDVTGRMLWGSPRHADAVLTHPFSQPTGMAHVLRAAAYIIREDATSAFIELEHALAAGVSLDQLDDALPELPTVSRGRSVQTGPIRSATWLLTAGKQVRAVARIERTDGTFVGSGVYVDGRIFHPDARGVPCVLTCAHVCGGAAGSANGEDPVSVDDASIRFPGFDTPGDQPSRRATASWISPVSDLDACVLRLADAPPAPVESVERSAFSVISRETNIYLFAFPRGGPMGLSMESNPVDAVEGGRFSHTLGARPGSSGGPVFNWEDCGLAGIHRGETNRGKQGVLLSAIRQAARAAGVVGGWRR